jgi:hypothetical protein
VKLSGKVNPLIWAARQKNFAVDAKIDLGWCDMSRDIEGRSHDNNDTWKAGDVREDETAIASSKHCSDRRAGRRTLTGCHSDRGTVPMPVSYEYGAAGETRAAE